MRVLTWLILLVLMAFPLSTLVHRDDVGNWDVSRAAMTAPDEFSYLMVADSVMYGRGLHLNWQYGVESFYPPGYSLLLAGWGGFFGLTAFTAHALNAVLLAISVPLVFGVCRRMLPDREGICLLVTAIYITNWHVTEGALFVFSEPAFICVTMLWLLLALSWRGWQFDAGKSVVIALLAVLAWSIRSAGIVCVAATFVFPLVEMLRGAGSGGRPWWRRFVVMGALVVFGAGYHLFLNRHPHDPENSYSHQLINGLTHGGAYSDKPVKLVVHIGKMILSHLDDFAATFTRWFRDYPDPPSADIALLSFVQKAFGILALGGLFWRVVNFRRSATLIVELYVLAYFGLYLVWPFDMQRFWAPLLPLSLCYAAEAIAELWQGRSGSKRAAMAVLLSLLLLLNVQEITLQLHFYQRRVNFVSDSLAAAVRQVVRENPDPGRVAICVCGQDDVFQFDWYLREFAGYRVIPPPVTKERPLEQLMASELERLKAHEVEKVLILGYFNDEAAGIVWTLGNLEKDYPELMKNIEKRVIFRHSEFEGNDRVIVWELVERR